MRRLGRNRAHAEEEESVFVTMTDMTISFLLIIMILLAFFATQINDDETVPLGAYEKVRNERDALRVENQDLRAMIESLEAELARAISALEAVAAERDRLRRERDQLQGERDQLRGENAALRARLGELEKENAQLRSRIDRLSKEIERLRKALERFHVVNPLEAYLSQAIDRRRKILVELRDRLLIEFPELQVVISPEQDALRFQGEGLFRSGSSRLQPRQRAIVETMGRLLDEILVCFTLGERARRGPECDSGDALIEAVQIEGTPTASGPT